ncbi:MAG: hypothetical protein IPN97_09970 [Saprospiraceae bacterium]|nr:hypothetical protein [Saprospiraceae bacterium]
MNKNNCTTGGDLLCDTPPDYNFGNLNAGCTFTQDIWDFNKEKIIPQKKIRWAISVFVLIFFLRRIRSPEWSIITIPPRNF